MSDNISELVKRLRAVRCGPVHVEAADALEAMAGEVERLTSQRDAEHQKYLKTYDLMGSESHRADKAQTDRDRLKAALEQVRHLSRLRISEREDAIHQVARKALGDAS